ncbi:hypothetical protein D3C79_770580 [compost metagenome]
MPLIPQPARQGQRLGVILGGLAHVAEQLLMKAAAGEQAALGDPVLALTGLVQRLLGKPHRPRKIVIALGRLGPALQPGDAPLHLCRIVTTVGRQNRDPRTKLPHRWSMVFQLLQLPGQTGLGERRLRSPGGGHSQP